VGSGSGVGVGSGVLVGAAVAAGGAGLDGAAVCPVAAGCAEEPEALLQARASNAIRAGRRRMRRQHGEGQRLWQGECQVFCGPACWANIRQAFLDQVSL
jgi:hypothetical protein